MANGKKCGDVVGAAMVVGGGVAGVQAALDLANAGVGPPGELRSLLS